MIQKVYQGHAHTRWTMDIEHGLAQNSQNKSGT